MRQALPAPPSLPKQLLRFVAELRESLNPRPPILSTRVAESLDNRSTSFNSSTPPSPSNETALVGDYIVEAGDTFDSIAAKLGITATALEIANPGLDPLDLGIGDVVIIPQGFVGSGNGTTVGNVRILSAENSTALPPSSTALPPCSSASDGAFSGWYTWIGLD
jgi:LysM repeat protein